MKKNTVCYFVFALAFFKAHSADNHWSLMCNTEYDQRSDSVINTLDVGLEELFPILGEHFTYTEMCNIAQPIQTETLMHHVPVEFTQRESESEDDSPMVQLLSQSPREDSGTNNLPELLDFLLQPTKSVSGKADIMRNTGTKTKKNNLVESDESSSAFLIKSIINKRFEALPVECCAQKISSRKQLLAHFRLCPHIVDGKATCPHASCAGTGRGSEDYNLLAEHYMTHFDANLFKCPNKGCPRVYQSSRVLVNHYLKKCKYND